MSLTIRSTMNNQTAAQGIDNDLNFQKADRKDDTCGIVFFGFLYNNWVFCADGKRYGLGEIWFSYKKTFFT